MGKESIAMPDFKLIYTDIINEKFPEKINDPLIRNKLNALNTAVDVLKFNILVFGESEYPILLVSEIVKTMHFSAFYFQFLKMLSLFCGLST
ncbi:hypothetical protein HHL23_20995 [Chryseobacterium sp. RP-3-3]|uniref:Uncharacterized protein n=1 Tax=Chryseobacterium antibioticum TaxID=2728847 RepID=A0A7Y0ARX2_9FLAO|nr:hypothetical protein [Chryseobacterium antibioticum]NML72242.1 hypothetical protein [Chryseobacterium antibioticum]